MDLCLNISAGEVDIPAGENVFVVCFILFVNSLHILAGLHAFVDFVCVHSIFYVFLMFLLHFMYFWYC